MALTQQDKEEMYQYLISKGKGVASLDEGDSNLSNKYLAPVLEYTAGGSAGKVVRLAVSLLQGKSAILRKSGDLVQWQLQGASTWDNLYSLEDYRGLPGINGKNPIFRCGATGIEGKLDGEDDTAYKLLVALADIIGPQGDHAVLRAINGKLEYKLSQEPDTAYKQILSLSDIVGPQGRPGKDFQILGYYNTVAVLRATVTNPEPGEAYGIGTVAPYPIYIWDAVSSDWVNNGAIQGPTGLSGKSARISTTTGCWQEYDDNTQLWKDTEYIVQYITATAEKDGLMSKEDKSKLDEIKGGDIEVSKENIEKVLTGSIASHTHDQVMSFGDMPTDIWDGTTISTVLDGVGTIDNPYLIKSCADYIHFFRNPALYGHIMPTAGPTAEQIANPKHIKFASNLDFDNIAINLGETIPNMGSLSSEAILLLCFVDGQGCRVSNINFINTWAVMPLAAYCSIRDLHIMSGVFTVPLSMLQEKGFLATDVKDTIAITPFGIMVEMSIVENVSFVGDVKFTGDIGGFVTFIAGASVSSFLGELSPELKANNPYFYSNVTFSADEGMTSLLSVRYFPACKQDETADMIGYDCTKTTTDVSAASSGLIISLFVDGLSSAYTLYVNTDNATPMYLSGDVIPFHTTKTTAEMLSPDFLVLLNGDMDRFVADTENVNAGYPVFKPKLVEQVVYDGYVYKKEVDKIVSSLRLSVYVLPDRLISLSNDSTSEEISDVIGGIAGFDKLSTMVGHGNAFLLCISIEGFLNATTSANLVSQKDSTTKSLFVFYIQGSTSTTIHIVYNLTTHTFSVEQASDQFYVQGTGKGLSTKDFTAEYEKSIDFITGVNTLTTLADIPIDKQTFYATINSDQSISVSVGLKPGRCIQGFIKNSGSTARIITIPNTGAYISMSGISAILPASGWLEVNIACYADGQYNIRVGGRD